MANYQFIEPDEAEDVYDAFLDSIGHKLDRAQSLMQNEQGKGFRFNNEPNDRYLMYLGHIDNMADMLNQCFESFASGDYEIQ